MPAANHGRDGSKKSEMGKKKDRGEGAYQGRRGRLLRRAMVAVLFIAEGEGKRAKRGGNPNQFPPSLRMHAGS
jgi:hypothetical protein